MGRIYIDAITGKPILDMLNNEQILLEYNMYLESSGTTLGYNNSMVKMSDDILVIAQLTNFPGYPELYPGVKISSIKTFTINHTGGTITEIERLEFDYTDPTGNTLYNGFSLVKASDNIYVLTCFKDDDYKGYFISFNIDSDGTNITKLDDLQFSTGVGVGASLVKMDDELFMSAYMGDASNRTWLQSFNMDVTGGTLTTVDLLNTQLQTTWGRSLIQLSDDIGTPTLFCLLYDGTFTSDPFILTFTSDINGDNITTGSTLHFHTGITSAWKWNVKIDETHFLVVYNSQDSSPFHAWLKTFSCDATGGTITELDSYEYYNETTPVSDLVLIEMNENRYLLTDSTGYNTSFRLDIGYKIVEDINEQFETEDPYSNSLIKIQDDKYGIVYTIDDAGKECRIKTFKIILD